MGAHRHSVRGSDQTIPSSAYFVNSQVAFAAAQHPRRTPAPCKVWRPNMVQQGGAVAVQFIERQQLNFTLYVHLVLSVCCSWT